MAKTHAKKSKAATTSNDKVISQNRKARHNFTVLDTLECGIVLVGSEVKSLRNGRVSLDEAFARVKDEEVWLLGCDIAEYTEASRFNHNPRRPCRSRSTAPRWCRACRCRCSARRRGPICWCSWNAKGSSRPPLPPAPRPCRDLRCAKPKTIAAGIERPPLSHWERGWG